MRRRLGMGDQALGVAKVVGDADDRQRIGEGEGAALPPSTSNATSVPPPSICFLRHLVVGVVGAAGIEHFFDRGWALRKSAIRTAEACCWATRTCSVSSDFSITQALNGERLGPVWRRKL